MNWARRLKRVFGVEIKDCARCGGKLKIIASIEEPQVVIFRRNGATEFSAYWSQLSREAGISD